MDFSWTEDETREYERVVAFAQTLDNESVVERDKTLEFPRSLWQRCADFGIQSLPVPGDYHSHGDTPFMTAMLSMEALGFGWPRRRPDVFSQCPDVDRAAANRPCRQR